LQGENVMGQLFDWIHIAYIVISLSVTIMLLVLGKRHLKSQFQKDLFLKVFALLTFFIHISIMWYDFLKQGFAYAPNHVLFPIYFCNLSMYLLLIVAYYGNKNTSFFKILAITTAYAGTFGALISLFYPTYYIGSSSMFEWGVFKSLMSHSTMLVGSLWLIIGQYFKIEKNHAVVYFGGLLFYGAIGVFVNQLYRIFELGDPNAMYLSHPPLTEVPILNAYTISFLMVLFIYIFTLIYHALSVKVDVLNHEKAYHE
jgi:hypothetical protein